MLFTGSTMPTIVITGASQGIGRALALHYARAPEAASGVRPGSERPGSVRLALLARNAGNLAAVAAECRRAGAEAEVFVCDVTNETQVTQASGAAMARWGAPDVLVNNAGVFVPGAFLEITPEAFRSQIEVNLTSAFLVTRAFLPAMLARGSSPEASGDDDTPASPSSSPIPPSLPAGDIVFMASVASTRGYPGGAAYGAAKHGLLGLARTLREETKDRGLRVITVMPGATLTPSWDGVDVPPSRLMTPEAIAQTVAAATSLPRGAVIEEVLIRPQLGDL